MINNAKINECFVFGFEEKPVYYVYGHRLMLGNEILVPKIPSSIGWSVLPTCTLRNSQKAFLGTKQIRGLSSADCLAYKFITSLCYI